MEMVILDDVKSRRAALAETLEKNRYKVVQCATSNEFMNALNTLSPGSPGLFLVDVDTWRRGRSLYAYFQVGKKMERFPVLFYNAPPNFTAVGDRARHEKDYVLQKPSEVNVIVEAVANTL